MKNLLLKLRTLIVVLLIIAAAGIIIWVIGTIGQLAKNDSSIKGSIAFAILGIGFISIFVVFIVKHSKINYSKKNTEKAEMLKENIRGEITKKHSSN